MIKQNTNDKAKYQKIRKRKRKIPNSGIRVMVFNATFNNISVIWWPARIRICLMTAIDII